jgi:hypothetical protein
VRTVFDAYGRRYFSPDMSMVGAGAREASEAVERVKLNMVGLEKQTSTAG